MTGMTRRWRRRTERGAAAVEGGLVSAFILGPLLVGILFFGNLFWKEQPSSLYPPRLNQSMATGICSETQIAGRVASAAAESIYALNRTTLDGLLDGLGVPEEGRVQYIAENFLTTTVTSLGSVGADVDVELNLPPTGFLGGVAPGSQATVRDVRQRLTNVSVSTDGQSGTGCYPLP